LNLASALVLMAKNTPVSTDAEHCCISMAVPDSNISVISDRVQRLLSRDFKTNLCARRSLLALCLASFSISMIMAFNPHVQALCYKAFEKFISI
jgi:hypothetical protein